MQVVIQKSFLWMKWLIKLRKAYNEGNHLKKVVLFFAPQGGLKGIFRICISVIFKKLGKSLFKVLSKGIIKVVDS